MIKLYDMINSLYFQEFSFKNNEKLYTQIACSSPEVRLTGVRLLSPQSKLSFC